MSADVNDIGRQVFAIEPENIKQVPADRIAWLKAPVDFHPRFRNRAGVREQARLNIAGGSQVSLQLLLTFQ